MPQNPLNYHVRYPKAVEIAAESAACGMPALPLGNPRVPFKLMLGFLVIGFALTAVFAPVEGWQDRAVYYAAEREGIARTIRKDWPSLPIARAQTVHFQPLCDWANYRHWRPTFSGFRITDAAIPD
jgi:hypothetical protein